MSRTVLRTRGWWKFSLADIKKIFCRSNLWSKISQCVSCAAWNVFPINSLTTGWSTSPSFALVLQHWCMKKLWENIKLVETLDCVACPLKSSKMCTLKSSSIKIISVPCLYFRPTTAYTQWSMFKDLLQKVANFWHFLASKMQQFWTVSNSKGQTLSKALLIVNISIGYFWLFLVI